MADAPALVAEAGGAPLAAPALAAGEDPGVRGFTPQELALAAKIQSAAVLLSLLPVRCQELAFVAAREPAGAPLPDHWPARVIVLLFTVTLRAPSSAAVQPHAKKSFSLVVPSKSISQPLFNPTVHEIVFPK